MWASIAVVVYIILLPIGYFYLLSQAKSEIEKLDRGDVGIEDIMLSNRLEPLQILYRKYKSNFWYWEIIELYFRVSITGFLVLIRPGSFLQVEVGFLLIFIYAKLLQLCSPYKHDKLQALKVITIWQLFFIFHVAFLIQGGELQSDSDTTTAILFLIAIACVIFDFTLYLLEYFSTRIRFIARVVEWMPSYLFPQSDYLSSIRESSLARREMQDLNAATIKDTSSGHALGNRQSEISFHDGKAVEMATPSPLHKTYEID